MKIEAVTERSGMHLPIGYSNFRDIILSKLDYVDKTLLIKKILDTPETSVTVITRPRRFGKTLNLSMLHYFLAEEVYGCSTQGLFEGLKIAESGEQYLRHQGKYPVIFVTFKDVADDNYQDVYLTLCHVISHLYGEHEYLLSSPKLSSRDKEVFLSLLEERASTAQVSSSLYRFSTLIEARHWIASPSLRSGSQ